MIYKKLGFKADVVDETNYTIRGVFSTEDEDRHGEIIDQKGWKLDNYKTNPVVLWAHDHWQPTIGQMMDITVNADGKLEGTIKFAVEEYDFAKTIFQLYKGKFMRAFSVGFENTKYEVDDKNDVIILRENELYEVSAVTVPANAQALAKSKGIDTEPIERAAKIKIWDETNDYIRHRVKEPGLFDEGTFRTVELKKDKPRVKAVMGKLKGEDTMTIQSFLFPKEDGWTMEEAKKWVADHPDVSKSVIKDEATDETIEHVSRINKETILSAIKTLNEVLKAREEADNQVKEKGRIPPERGGRKVYVKVLNRAIRALLETKRKI